MCISKLELIMKGDVTKARMLDSALSEHPDDSGDNLHSSGHSNNGKHNDNNNEKGWTSFQLTEAHSVLNRFLKKRSGKCSCGAKNPAITKPTVGWIYMVNFICVYFKIPLGIYKCSFYSVIIFVELTRVIRVCLSN